MLVGGPIDAAGHSETLIGSYRIVRRIAVGGTGEVFEARHAVLGTRVAIKCLLPGLAERSDLARRLVREARAASTLQHPNIAPVFDVVAHAPVPYLVMEYLDGVDLRAWLDREAPLSIAQALALLRPLLDAVSFAHAHGVIHRDLKPSNVIIVATSGTEPRPVLIDFGLAHGDGFFRDSLVTEDAAVLGTPAYFAPELCDEGGRATEATDQYALAVIAYELLTGRRPHEGTNLAALIRHILEGRIVPPCEMRPEIPRPLSDVVLRALSREPSQRFPSVETFARALAGAAEMPTVPVRPRPRRYSVLGIALLAASIVAAVAIGRIGATRAFAASPHTRAPSVAAAPAPPSSPAPTAAPPAPPASAPRTAPSAPAARAAAVVTRRPRRMRSVVPSSRAADAGTRLAACTGPNGVDLCL